MSVFRFLMTVFVATGMAVAVAGETVEVKQGSFLVITYPKSNRIKRWSCYEPREGDVFIGVARRLCSRPVMRVFTRTNEIHAGIMVKDSCGNVRLLEADRGTGVRMHDPIAYLADYRQNYGDVYIRRLTFDLSEEESEALTCFAEEIIGRDYAAIHELINAVFAQPFIDRASPGQWLENPDRWFCSEVVVAALQEAGLLHPDIRSSSMIPNYLMGDLLAPDWDPPHRWTPAIVRHLEVDKRWPLAQY